MPEDELLDAVGTLRMKLRAAKGLIRDLTVCAADVERLLLAYQQAEPKEAEPNERHQRHNHVEQHRERLVA